ncbi:hypothetical protein COLO4_09584 [Corchorus olitorius]|uniref:Cullin N-terminal domain-containing protein n=1 Tax=Corchorus olitorius TaxID=93759 RepID=A0A1R3KBI5_9ROSI|nr:hypothetical protein COLO4_09584 [Corchorus olitorius]
MSAVVAVEVYIGMTCFRDLVYKVVHEKVTKAVISLINEEREGKQIDRALMVKDVLGIFVEMGMDYYKEDFETELIKDSGDYYSSKASSWINEEDSCPDYLIKVEECLNKEKERVTHYLNSSTETKLIEKVQHELLVVHSNQLLENENSGSFKADDLSRMLRLYSEIPQVLNRVVNMLEQHMTTLIQQGEDAAGNLV